MLSRTVALHDGKVRPPVQFSSMFEIRVMCRNVNRRCMRRIDFFFYSKRNRDSEKKAAGLWETYNERKTGNIPPTIFFL